MTIVFYSYATIYVNRWSDKFSQLFPGSLPVAQHGQERRKLPVDGRLVVATDGDV